MQDYIYYNDIAGDYPNSWYIPYELLLNTFEWRQFRKEIIDRDKSICQFCNMEQSTRIGNSYFRKPTAEEIEVRSKESPGRVFGDGSSKRKVRTVQVIGIRTETPIILHVHHKYYIFGELPWGYKNDAVVTVCHDCHFQIHQNEIIPVYSDINLNEKLDLTPCSRCNGTGFLEQFHHVQNGICFRCSGRRFEEFIR